MPDFAQKEIAALFAKPCVFMLSVADLYQLPADDKTEIAFAGRSNVGKSSLINALFKQKNLAKTSATPGRTQQLNYFNFADLFYVVDLPGYGFAKAPGAQVKKWQDMLKNYLKGRASLRRVFLLIDAKVGFKSADKEIMDLLDASAVNYQIVLTKADKIKEKEAENALLNAKKEALAHAAALNDVLLTSSEKGFGIDDLRAQIAGLS